MMNKVKNTTDTVDSYLIKDKEESVNLKQVI